MKMRVIFMGTPDFAVRSLELLIGNDAEVVAVVTAPDKPKGRGLKLLPSPVKVCAQAHNIPVLQPTNLKSEEFLSQLKAYAADLQVVVAFRMLPEVVWRMPPLGTINLHASLLPQYRGAAPIHWAIINGEQQTGVTTFLLKHKIDTGDILFQEQEPIYDNDTTGSLYGRLMEKGAHLVVRTVRAIEAGEHAGQPQQWEGQHMVAPKIDKDLCEIDWHKPSQTIRNLVRGLSPYPGARTKLNNVAFKIYACHVPDQDEIASRVGNAENTPMVTDHKTYVWFKTGDGWLAIDEWQPEGKKRMAVQAYFRGHQLPS